MIPGVHEIEMEDKMADMYNHHTVEKKWQKIWDDEKAFKTENDYTKPKFYALVEFPYPSGQGLHVGHPRPYTALDIVARKRKCRDTMYYILWDGMHLVFLLKTMLSRIKFIQKRLLRRMLQDLKSSFIHSVILLTGTER